MGLWAMQCVARLVIVRDDLFRSSDVTRGLGDQSPFAITSLWGKIAAVGIGAMLFLGLTLWAAVWLTIRLL